MKKLISIIFFLIVTVFIIFLAKKNNFVSHEIANSSHYFVQEGINHSKQKQYKDAEIKFQEALNSIKKDKFKLFFNDIKDFSTLINNIKVNTSSKYSQLQSNLSAVLKEKIEKLQKSSDIDTELKQDFVSEINRLLLNDEIFKKWEDEHCKDSADLISEKNNILKTAKNTFKISDESLRQFNNRLILSIIFQEFFRLPLTQYEVKFNIALMYHGKGEYKKSNEILSDILKDVPLYKKAYILTARNFEMLGEVNNAISLLMNYKENNNEDEEILTELAALYHKTNDIENSKKMLDSALRINPNYSYALESLDILDRKKSGKLKPISYYLEKIKKEGESINNLSNLSLAYLKNKDFVKSDEVVIRALSKYPNDIFLLKLKARILGNQRKYMEVVEILNKLKKITNNKDSEIYLLLGVTYFNQHLNYEAYEILKEGLNIFPDDAYLNLNMGMICEVMPEHDNDALLYYEKYLKLKPNAKNSIKVKSKIESLKGKAVK